MKTSHLMFGLCLGILISTSSYGYENCCAECIKANPQKYYTSPDGFTGTYHPDCYAGSTAGGPDGRHSMCASSGCYTSNGLQICSACDFQPFSDCEIDSNDVIRPYTTCTTTSYSCIEGYYGTPTSSNSTCTKCPANATCPAGSTTFTCNTGYQKIGNNCIKCPSNATCDANGNIKCNQSYYLSGSTCNQCPPPGMTGGAGATSITACFIYHIDESLTTRRWYDETGYFNVTQNCYYSTTETPKHPVLGAGTPK